MKTPALKQRPTGSLKTCEIQDMGGLAGGHSHSDLRELLFGKVQRMVDGSDPILGQIGSSGQVCTQDGVVGHVHERHHGMPALIIIPHLGQELNDEHTCVCFKPQKQKDFTYVMFVI